jgi:desulfoferrodoxin-like iron-binding protein
MLQSANGNQEVKNQETEMIQLGKRYRCEVCGTEVLCSKAGQGTLNCCEKEMKVQEPKPIPSSD